ncbi:MAG: non-canonical purine NTP pyrophosphatase [Acidimicrobiia bacterium]
MKLPAPGRFVLATGNVDKAREINEVLSAALDEPLAAWAVEVDDTLVGFVVQGATEPFEPLRLAAAPDVEETGATLEENARIKAVGVGTATGLPAIADDTGLLVDALGGAPGVHSARYAGPEGIAADNVAKLLDALRDVPDGRRTARFETVILVRWTGGRELVARGAVEGTIARAPSGANGFGYDPVFVPAEGDGRSFAEMTAQEKHARSHRGRAVRMLAAALRDA